MFAQTMTGEFPIESFNIKQPFHSTGDPGIVISVENTHLAVLPLQMNRQKQATQRGQKTCVSPGSESLSPLPAHLPGWRSSSQTHRCRPSIPEACPERWGRAGDKERTACVEATGVSSREDTKIDQRWTRQAFSSSSSTTLHTERALDIQS